MVRLSSSASRRNESKSIGAIVLRHWSAILLGALVLVALAAVSILRDDMHVSEAVLNAIDEVESGAKKVMGEDSASIAGAGASASVGRPSGEGDGGDSSLRRSGASLNSENTAPNDRDVHKVAGLSCTKYGGPSDEIAAEMVYWKDIAEDSAYVSPFREYGPEKKYLTFEPDEGGFNNIVSRVHSMPSLHLFIPMIIPNNTHSTQISLTSRNNTNISG